MTVQIERAHLKDVHRQEYVLRSAFGAYFELLGHPQTQDAYEWLPQAVAEKRVLCALLKTDIVGVAILNDQDTTRNIQQLAVLPEKQGVGIGSAFLAWIESDAKKDGFEKLTLYSAEMMHDLIQLYERRGFSIIGTGPPYNGLDAHMRVFMAKSLIEN